MSLSLCKKLQLRDLTPTSITIQLADCSIRQPVVILEDVSIQVGKFLIPCDFVVLDMDEDFPAPLIFVLATAGIVIVVQADTLSFQLCEERVDFSFPPLALPLAPVLPSPSEEPISISPFDDAPGVDIFDGNGGPHMLVEGSSAVSAAVLFHFVTGSAYSGEVEDPISHFYNHPRPPPVSLSSTIWS